MQLVSSWIARSSESKFEVSYNVTFGDIFVIIWRVSAVSAWECYSTSEVIRLVQPLIHANKNTILAERIAAEEETG